MPLRLTAGLLLLAAISAHPGACLAGAPQHPAARLCAALSRIVEAESGSSPTRLAQLQLRQLAPLLDFVPGDHAPGIVPSWPGAMRPAACCAACPPGLRHAPAPAKRRTPSAAPRAP
jgi:hypothetical protein